MLLLIYWLLIFVQTKLLVQARKPQIREMRSTQCPSVHAESDLLVAAPQCELT